MCEPIRRSFSKDELINQARDFMIREEGAPKDLPYEERQDFYLQLGLLVHFCTDLFNTAEHRQSGAVSGEADG